jgi:hypothetical protein
MFLQEGVTLERNPVPSSVMKSFMGEDQEVDKPYFLKYTYLHR